jgi:FG-GAP repeat
MVMFCLGILSNSLAQNVMDERAYAGVVYALIQTDTDTFQLSQTLSSDPLKANGFGQAVAVDGDTLVVGNPYNEGDTPDQPGNSHQYYKGAVYIYEKQNSSWQLVKKLKDDTRRELTWYGKPTSDRFGQTVALESNMLIVSSIDRVFIYERNQGGEGNWGQIQTIEGHFDIKAIDGNTLIMNSGGAIYVFEYNPNTKLWKETTQLKPSDLKENSYFGESAAIDGDTLVVSASGQGTAYIFERNQGAESAWGEVQKIPSATPSVDIDRNRIAVLAYIKANDEIEGKLGAIVFEKDLQTGMWLEIADMVTIEPLHPYSSGGDFEIIFENQTIVIGKQLGDPARKLNVPTYITYPFWATAYIFREQGDNYWIQVSRFVGDIIQAGWHSRIALAFDSDTIILGSDWSGGMVRPASFYP